MVSSIKSITKWFKHSVFTISRVDYLGTILHAWVQYFQSSSSFFPGFRGFKLYLSLRTMFIFKGLSFFFPFLPYLHSFSVYALWTRLAARFCLQLLPCSSRRTRFGLSPNVWHKLSKFGTCCDAWLVTDWFDVVVPLLGASLTGMLVGLICAAWLIIKLSGSAVAGWRFTVWCIGGTSANPWSLAAD